MSRLQDAVAPASVVERRRHVCVFYDSTDEKYRVLSPFIGDGFAKGDKAFHIIDGRKRPDHQRRLWEFGIDVDATERTGQLEVRGVVHENSFFVRRDELLRELRRRPDPAALTA